MKLHRAATDPDWAKVRPSDRNWWQHVAARTYGIVTPGNMATIIGVIGVGVGLWLITRQDYWFGLILLAVGRLLDVVDGFLADTTGTKSPLGEKLDAGFDKLGTFATLMVFAAVGIAPWWILIALLLPHAVISIITLLAVRSGRPIHPSRYGKLSMASAWVGLVGLVVIKAVNGVSGGILPIVVYGILAGSIMLGVTAAAGYAAGRDTVGSD